MAETPRYRLRWIPYAVACSVHLLLLAAESPWARWTQMTLMVALAWPAARVRPPLRTWVFLALALSWCGDSLPRFWHPPAEFLAMAALFLLAQLVWVMALGNRWSLTVPARRPATGVLYVVTAIVIGGGAVLYAGAFTPVIILYAVALTAEAVLASSMGERGIWGGILFMVSGSLLAYDRFVPHFRFPGIEVLTMFTYLVAQGLLVGAAARIRDPRAPRLGDAH